MSKTMSKNTDEINRIAVEALKKLNMNSNQKPEVINKEIADLLNKILDNSGLSPDKKQPYVAIINILNNKSQFANLCKFVQLDTKEGGFREFMKKLSYSLIGKHDSGADGPGVLTEIAKITGKSKKDLLGGGNIEDGLLSGNYTAPYNSAFKDFSDLVYFANKKANILKSPIFDSNFKKALIIGCVVLLVLAAVGLIASTALGLTAAVMAGAMAGAAANAAAIALTTVVATGCFAGAGALVYKRVRHYKDSAKDFDDEIKDLNVAITKLSKDSRMNADKALDTDLMQQIAVRGLIIGLIEHAAAPEENAFEYSFRRKQQVLNLSNEDILKEYIKSFLNDGGSAISKEGDYRGEKNLSIPENYKDIIERNNYGVCFVTVPDNMKLDDFIVKAEALLKYLETQKLTCKLKSEILDDVKAAKKDIAKFNKILSESSNRNPQIW